MTPTGLRQVPRVPMMLNSPRYALCLCCTFPFHFNSYLLRHQGQVVNLPWDHPPFDSQIGGAFFNENGPTHEHIPTTNDVQVSAVPDAGAMLWEGNTFVPSVSDNASSPSLSCRSLD